MAAALSPVMIGREDLLALADRRWSAARTGRGQLLFFAGEAGIGKTRLLAEFAARRRKAGTMVVEAAAFPGDNEPTGTVLVDLAVELQRRGGPTAEAGERMRRRLAEGPRPEDDPGRRRRLLIADLVAMLAGLGTSEVPVLLVLEDLHWADGLTLDVLDRLAHRLPTAPMLVVGTYRSDELYPQAPVRRWRTRLLSQRLAEEAKLSRLAPAQTLAMCTAITGDVLPGALTATVHARSDGIPLHIEEILAGTETAVPETLADAILLRAQALTPSGRDLAAAAAVLGRVFDVDMLAAMTDQPAQSVDIGLRDLVEHFFVQPRGDGVSYIFRHALIRDTLYSDLPPLRRRQLHARAAELAVAAGLRDALVSEHYERAQMAGAAYRHALVAAREAVAMSAHRDAVHLFRRAQRTAGSTATPAERADLLTGLADALAAVDDNAAAAPAYEEAHSLRRGLGDRTGAAGLVPAWVLARHRLGDDLATRVRMLHAALDTLDAGDPVRAAIEAALATAYMLDRRLDESLLHGARAKAAVRGAVEGERLLEEIDVTIGADLVFAGRMDEGWPLMAGAVDRARQARHEAQAARGYRMIGSCASVLVEYALAERNLQEGIAYAERIEMWNDRHYMAAHLAHVRWASGAVAEAESVAGQALADGRGGLTTRITALYVLGYAALARCRWDEAHRHLAEALELGEGMRELQRFSPALWGLAELSLHTGHPADAVRWCERGFQASAAVEDAAYLFPFTVTGTRAYLKLDDISAARDWVGRTGRLLRHRGIPGTLPAIDHAAGLVHMAGGQTGKAREALEKASAQWDARGRFWEGVQALRDRARCAARSRRPADEARLTAEANERAREIPLLRGETPVRPAEAGPLTAREVEVARLIANGATNREIAQSLHIAPKTVAAHVEHILAKLGAARRTEIAAWVTRRGAGDGRTIEEWTST